MIARWTDEQTGRDYLIHKACEREFLAAHGEQQEATPHDDR